jgi:glutamate formiminotransferase
VNDIAPYDGAQDDPDGPEPGETPAPMMLAVPNVSEGTDPDIIAALAGACSAGGAVVLDLHSDPDHDRTVLSVAGAPLAIVDALVGLASTARDLIDIRRQRGAHPRTGALDVAPIVVLGPEDFAIARDIAQTVAWRIGDELGIPVFFYGMVATHPELARPHGLRTLGMDGLSAALADGSMTRDAGPGHVHPTAGCVLVGVRPPLIAWNVALPHASVAEARAIADRVRETGGGIPGVRAMGLYLPQAGIAQISMNLEDSRGAPPWVVMAAVRREAERLGVELGDSELVGLMPRHALGDVDPRELGLVGFRPAQLLETRCPGLDRDEN